MVKHTFIQVRPLFGACLLLLVAEAEAQPTESVDPVNNDELVETPVIESSDKTTGPEVEDLSLDNRQEKEEYNIYRKENPEDPCDRGLDSYDYKKSWYDDTQVYINSRFCEPALWFDNFFSNDRVFDEGVAGTYIRWRHEFTQDEEESFSYKMALSASVELPILEKNLRLTFEGDQDEDLRDIAPGNGGNTTNSLGLQLDVKKNDRSKFSINISLTPRIRLRYRYTYPMYDDITLRFTQEIQREDSVHSGRAVIDFEKTFEQNYLFRTSTEGKQSEEFEGVDWVQAFALYKRLNKKTSISYETSVTGITKPHALATDYRVGFRYRRNFHRKWLFYEIVPEITWPITLDDARLNVLQERRSKWLLFFRLEVHFGNAYEKRYQDYN